MMASLPQRAPTLLALVVSAASVACATARPAHPLLGQPAPAFDLSTLSGGERAVAGATGKVTLVDFWATWCESCKRSFPHHQALADRYKGRLVVIGVSEDDSSDGVEAKGRAMGARFSLAFDDQNRLAESYRPPALPTVYLIDQRGVVRYVHSGFEDGDERLVAAQVEALLGP